MLQKFMRIHAVMDATGRSRSWIYAAMKEDRFPKPVKTLGGRSSRWLESEVAQWQRIQIEARNHVDAAAA